MKLLLRLTPCLKLLVLLVLGLATASAQTLQTNASPSATDAPLTITVSPVGVHQVTISFYIGTSPSNVFESSPINIPSQNGTASYAWTPNQPGTYYLGATCAPVQYCDFKVGPVTQIVDTAPSYFGFYDSSADEFADAVPTTSSFTNTAWVNCSSPTDCTTRLQEAQKYNMHAVVETFTSPMLPAPGSSSAAVQTWLNNFKSNWQLYTSAFSPFVANGTLVAFWPYDEPVGGEWSAGNNAADTTSYLSSAATVIKQSFPSSKVGMFFTGALTFTYLVHGQNVIPPNFDWIGIDIYECWSTCKDKSTGGTLSESYTWYVQNLEANLYSGQKVILAPATAVYTPGTYAGFEASPPLSGISTDVGIVQDILDLAGTDDHVVGVFGFLYQTYYQNGSPNPQVWVGCSDPKMTSMLNVVTEFGEYVEGR